MPNWGTAGAGNRTFFTVPRLNTGRPLPPRVVRSRSSPDSFCSPPLLFSITTGVVAGKYYFFDLSWKVEEGRYATRFDAAFPKRRDVRFYFGAKLDAADMLAVYDALEETNFPTLYAATHPADDFAESFASYVHVVMLGRDHEVRLYRQGKLVKTVGPCWGQPRCAYTRTALESALGFPVTR